MSNITNEKIKCERCQIDQANIICQACQPFHYFCPRCDSIVHSMRIRLSHTRQNLNSDFANLSFNSKSLSTNNCSNMTSKFDFNNNKNEKNLTPLKNFRVSTPNATQRGASFFGDGFLKEVNRIHMKEKESLKFKIDTLENNNERLKINFQNEIKNMEERINRVLNDKINSNHTSNVKEAKLKDQETREEQLGDLDIRLKSLSPRKGKIEVEDYDRRLNELEKHERKLEKHKENIDDNNNKSEQKEENDDNNQNSKNKVSKIFSKN